jgi:hypothetical protein
MQKTVLISIIVTVLFCFFKFFEMKYLEDDLKPLKNYVRDACIVFFSSFIASYVCFHLDSSITDFFNVITENKGALVMQPQIFTDNPGF